MLANLKVAISEVSRWPMLRCWWQRRVEAKKLAMGIARVCPESACASAWTAKPQQAHQCFWANCHCFSEKLAFVNPALGAGAL
jgi:hypothetical protein